MKRFNQYQQLFSIAICTLEIENANDVLLYARNSRKENEKYKKYVDI